MKKNFIIKLGIKLYEFAITTCYKQSLRHLASSNTHLLKSQDCMLKADKLQKEKANWIKRFK